MKIRKGEFMIPIILILMLIAVSGLPGAETHRLDEQAAVDRAVEANLGLASQRLDLSFQQKTADLAWNVLVPSLRVTGRYAQDWVTSSGETAESAGASLQVQAALSLSAAAFEGVRTAALQFRTGLISYESAVQAIERQVRKEFYNLLLLQEQVRLQDARVLKAEESLRLTQAGFREGAQPAVNVKRAQTALVAARLERSKQATNAQDALARFRLLLAYPADDELVLVGELVPPSGPVGGGDGLLARSDIRLAAARISEQESVVQRTALAARVPTLSLDAAYSPGLSEPFRPELPTHRSTLRTSIGLSLSINLSELLPFSSAALALERERNRLEALRTDLAARIESAGVEVRSLVRRIEDQRRTLEALDLSLSLAQEVYALTLEAYREGATDYLDLQDAEVGLFEAEFNRLREGAGLRSLMIDLEYALGEPTIRGQRSAR